MAEHPKKREKILILSDAHIAGEWSNFAAYQARVLELMTHYDHVVMNGDDWELFRVRGDHVRALGDLLETLTKRKSHKWQKDFDSEKSLRGRAENVIHGAKWFTEEFLDRFPGVYLHVVGGNHEHARHFHKVFKDIEKHQRERAEHSNLPLNFEWSPQAVRIGDALFTHGHLPMSGKRYTKTPVSEDMPDERETYPLLRLRQLENRQILTKFFKFFVPVEHRIFERVWGKREIAVGDLMKGLRQWDGTDEFSVSHNGIHSALRLDEIKHIFFGHTHIKFDNFQEENSGKIFHNTGAFVEPVASRPEDLGILEADLEGGKIANVRPVVLSREPDARGRQRPPGGITR